MVLEYLQNVLEHMTYYNYYHNNEAVLLCKDQLCKMTFPAL